MATTFPISSQPHVARRLDLPLSRRRRAAGERLGRGLSRRGRAGRDPRRPGRLDPGRLAGDRGSHSIPPRASSRFATPAASIWAAHQERRRAWPRRRPGGAKTRWSRAPEADVSVRILPPAGYAFARRLRDGATLAEAAEALTVPDRLRDPSRRPRRVRRSRFDHRWRPPMSAGAAAPSARALQSVARFTRALFGLVPASLALARSCG